jgi:tRNA nucleotidyltransferase (CCA-adding enzyme)
MSLEPVDALRSNELAIRVWESMGRPACSVTGGFVRDTLLGRPTTDLDFTLPGSADSVAGTARRLADALETRPHLLGREPRAVWRVETSDLKVELWPLGSLSVDDDILRRDFTCNALVWPLPDGPLIDRVGGLDDLRSGRLSAVSRGNLQDDPVRLLRAARFVAQLPSFQLDHRTSSLVRELAPSLAYAPRARTGQELALLMYSPGAERGVRTMLELGIFRYAAPADTAPDPSWMVQHVAAVGRLAQPDRHPVPAAVQSAGGAALLAMLLRAWGCPSEASLADYSWPRAERSAAQRAASMIERATAGVHGDVSDRRELIHAAGDSFPALLAAAAAVDDPDKDSARAWSRWWAQWQRGGRQLVNPTPLLSADEVAEIGGVAPGPDLGDLLRRLRLAQIRGEVRSAAGARRWLESHTGDQPADR